MVAQRAPLADVLAELCDTVDAESPEAMSTVMRMDPDGQRLWPVAGPRVPHLWNEAIAPVRIGPNMGSCGTAAFRKERVIISDIATDPLLSGLPETQSREIALGLGIRAAWSQPLLSRDDEVLGTFGMFHATPRRPSRRELRLIEEAGHIAVIAIEGERSRAAVEKAHGDLQKSEDRLRSILDAIPTQAWSLLADGRLDYLNQRWYEYTGVSPDQAHRSGAELRGDTTGTDLTHVVTHPDDVPAAVASWREEILPALKPAEFEIRMRRYDGEYRWFMVRVEPLLDERGRLVRWYGTNTDIEDLKRAQAKLRQDEQELREITDAIPQMIAVLSSEGNCVYANRFLTEYTGLTLAEMAGENFRAKVVHPEDVVRLQDERRHRLARGEPFENEQRLRRRDGRYRWFLIRYNPLRDERGRIIRWYATGMDIEDRKQAEDRMRNENLACARTSTDRRCSRRSSARPRSCAGCWPTRPRWPRRSPPCSSSARPAPAKS
jgi:PAS domain S-box-containing protein